MAAYTIDISGVEYRGETASATRQWDALHLALNSKLVLGIKDGVTEQSLVIMLMSMERSALKQLEDLLLKDLVVRASDDVPVASNMFRDCIQDYALLLGKAAQKNLSGFYVLRGADASAGPTEQ